MKHLTPLLAYIFSIGFWSAHAQCDCDMVLHDRSLGDGLQALDFANMPDSTSSQFLALDSTGWIELKVPYASVINGAGEVVPGAAICLGQLERRLYLKNVQGDSLNPITIKNSPGQVAEIKNEPTYAGLQIHDSKYFEVRGDCNLPDSVLGIYIHGVNSNGVEVSGKSEEFLIRKVRVDTAGTGVKVKDNRDAFYASCQLASVAAPDDSTWFASNIRIEACRLTNLLNEGIYMNNTSYKFEYACDVDRTYFAYEMDGVYLSNNQIMNTGKDGIQTTGVVRNCIVAGNEILNVGTSGQGAHGNGIHFGEGCSGRVSDNWVEKTTGSGVFAAGIGTITIFQNVISQTGLDGIRAYAGTQSCEGSCKYARAPGYFGLTNFYDLEELRIFNNTVVFAGEIAVNINAPIPGTGLGKVYVNNNILTEWAVAPLDFISSPTAGSDGFSHVGNNLVVADIASVGFVNGVLNVAGAYGSAGAMDVRLTATSEACDGGVELAWMEDYMSAADIDGGLRVQQERPDCGAFESSYALPAGAAYASTASCDCALPKEIYQFDGEGLGDGYSICLLDTLRSGRIWFQNLEGTTGAPVDIVSLQELTIDINYSSTAIAFANSAHFKLSGETMHLTASSPNNATVDFISGNTGNVVLKNLDIEGGDDLIDVSHGYGTNLLDTLIIQNVHLESTVDGTNLIRVKGKPTRVVLESVQARSSGMNQTLMDMNLRAGGDFGIYNSIFDGFDTDLTMLKWIQLAVQQDNGSYEAKKIELVNNTFVNLAQSNPNSQTNFRLLHKVGAGAVDSMLFVNNALHKSAIESTLTSANYKNSKNQISIFSANQEVIEHNFSTQILDSLHLDAAYIPEQNSPLVDDGLDLAGSPVRWEDYYDDIRPDAINNQTDIGACELSNPIYQQSFVPNNPEPEILVYPNPTSDWLKLKNLPENSIITIVNENGGLVYTESSSNNLDIPTYSWSEGVYYLKGSNGEQTFAKHIIVQH